MVEEIGGDRSPPPLDTWSLECLIYLSSSSFHPSFFLTSSFFFWSHSLAQWPPSRSPDRWLVPHCSPKHYTFSGQKSSRSHTEAFSLTWKLLPLPSAPFPSSPFLPSHLSNTLGNVRTSLFSLHYLEIKTISEPAILFPKRWLHPLSFKQRHRTSSIYRSSTEELACSSWALARQAWSWNCRQAIRRKRLGLPDLGLVHSGSILSHRRSLSSSLKSLLVDGPTWII